LLHKLAGALDLAQMPFRQREEGRQAHLNVTAELESGFPVSLRDEVGQRPFKDGSRRSKISLPEQGLAEQAARNICLSGAPGGLGFLQESLSCL
jgi:hypothetical protein